MVNPVNKNKLMTILATFVSLLLVITGFILIKNEIRKSEVRRHDLAVLRKDIENLDQLAVDYKSRGTDLEKVLATLPKNYQDVSAYADKADSLATDFGINLESNYSAGTNKETEGLNSLEVTLTARGSYESLIEFVREISNLPYHTKVLSMKLNQQEGQLTLLYTYKLYVDMQNEEKNYE